MIELVYRILEKESERKKKKKEYLAKSRSVFFNLEKRVKNEHVFILYKTSEKIEVLCKILKKKQRTVI